ncbi:hypothetical protein BDZ94DRAFT_1235295 [Collybia nuda]|uniref:Uncharacterized protein n=1 Tax=Collybia nuda TaxID=64659 RepID=A0A9P6CFX0_9AGAR|nr:hypothetical protein BDZ94DRAFT_1235295 [Collybia nuda]
MLISSAAYIALVITSSLGYAFGSAIPVRDLRARTITSRVATNVVRPALRRGGTALRGARLPIQNMAPKPAMPPVAPAKPPQNAAGSMIDLSTKVVALKAAAGATVGTGSLIFGHLQELNKEKAGESTIKKRNLAMKAGQALRTATRVSGKPNTARIMTKVPVARVAPQTPPGTPKVDIAKKTGIFLATGLVAGGMENLGGQHMEAASERFQAKQESMATTQPSVTQAIKNMEAAKKNKREYYQLLRRHTSGAVRLATTVARVGKQRASGAVARVAQKVPPAGQQLARVSPQTPGAKVAQAAKTNAKFVGLLGAAGVGGYIEGGIQNMPTDVQSALVKNPGTTITQLLPEGGFGKPKARREYIERLFARALLASVEDFE